MCRAGWDSQRAHAVAELGLGVAHERLDLRAAEEGRRLGRRRRRRRCRWLGRRRPGRRRRARRRLEQAVVEVARGLVGRVVDDAEVVGAARGVADVRAADAERRPNPGARKLGEHVVGEVAGAARLQQRAPAGDEVVRRGVVGFEELRVGVDSDRAAVVARRDAEAPAQAVQPAERQGRVLTDGPGREARLRKAREARRRRQRLHVLPDVGDGRRHGRHALPAVDAGHAGARQVGEHLEVGEPVDARRRPRVVAARHVHKHHQRARQVLRVEARLAALAGLHQERVEQRAGRAGAVVERLRLGGRVADGVLDRQVDRGVAERLALVVVRRVRGATGVVEAEEGAAAHGRAAGVVAVAVDVVDHVLVEQAVARRAARAVLQLAQRAVGHQRRDVAALHVVAVGGRLVVRAVELPELGGHGRAVGARVLAHVLEQLERLEARVHVGVVVVAQLVPQRPVDEQVAVVLRVEAAGLRVPALGAEAAAAVGGVRGVGHVPHQLRASVAPPAGQERSRELWDARLQARAGAPVGELGRDHARGQARLRQPARRQEGLGQLVRRHRGLRAVGTDAAAGARGRDELELGVPARRRALRGSGFGLPRRSRAHQVSIFSRISSMPSASCSSRKSYSVPVDGGGGGGPTSYENRTSGSRHSMLLRKVSRSSVSSLEHMPSRMAKIHDWITCGCARRGR